MSDKSEKVVPEPTVCPFGIGCEDTSLLSDLCRVNRSLFKRYPLDSCGVRQEIGAERDEFRGRFCNNPTGFPACNLYSKRVYEDRLKVLREALREVLRDALKDHPEILETALVA